MAAPRPVHTPYDGSARSFTIGLRPLDPDRWLEIGDDFVFQMREKRRLLAAHRGDVFAAEPDTGPAQREVLDLLLAYLPKRFPDTYRRGREGMLIAGSAGLGIAAMQSMPALEAASLLVREDLVLMRRASDGWRLAAASLCFPSSWTLSEKFGRPLHEIHAPVPGFGPSTRAAAVIDRIFDNLAVGAPVERLNWSIQSGAALYRPLSQAGRTGAAAQAASMFPGGDAAAHAHVRVERQTLSRLPRSGDILFTICIHLDPIAVLAGHPERRAVAAAFAAQLSALDADRLAYKGLGGDRDRLIERLWAIAAAG